MVDASLVDASLTGGLRPDAMLGEWAFERSILDSQNKCAYRVSGRAVFVWQGDAIRWYEEGLLHRDGGEFPVTRTLWLRRAAGQAVDEVKRSWLVEFDDGRPFHVWAPDDTVVHHCGADTYRGAIESDSAANVADDCEWSLTWDVSGPSKRYVSSTRYVRPETVRAP